jgi:hypothetical protein
MITAPAFALASVSCVMPEQCRFFAARQEKNERSWAAAHPQKPGSAFVGWALCWL